MSSAIGRRSAPAERAPFGTCPAPKILSAVPCGRFLEQGQPVCRQHQGTDATRRCTEAEAGPSKKARVRCHAWPLVASGWCAAHDPARKAERRAAQQEERPAHPLGPLRPLLSPALALTVLEQLVLRGRLTVRDVAEALTATAGHEA